MLIPKEVASFLIYYLNIPEFSTSCGIDQYQWEQAGGLSYARIV